MGGHLGRVGNCPPIFGQLSDAAAVAEAQSISTCQPSFRKLLTPLNLYSNILNVFFIQFSLYFLRPSLKHKIFLLSILTTSQWVSKHF